MKDLVSTQDLTSNDVQLLLDTAGRFAEHPLAERNFLANETVVVHMTKPSTRTRLASETAIAHLGGTPIFVRGDELQLGRGETIADTAKIISGYARALIIRTFKQSDVEELATHGSMSVINALTDDDHPTQGLADWLTIQEKFGKDLSGRKFTYVGDGNNMAHTWLSMGAVLGAHVVVASPPGRWMPNAEIVNRAKEIAASTGASVEVTNDVKAACTDASVIYTDVWMSMGDSESDRQEKIAALKEYSVTSSLMKLGTKDALFMHCLPAHRGEEVSGEVIDGPQSVVWREAFHRRTTIQSALYHLLRGDIKGR